MAEFLNLLTVDAIRWCWLLTTVYGLELWATVSDRNWHNPPKGFLNTNPSLIWCNTIPEYFQTERVCTATSFCFPSTTDKSLYWKKVCMPLLRISFLYGQKLLMTSSSCSKSMQILLFPFFRLPNSTKKCTKSSVHQHRNSKS